MKREQIHRHIDENIETHIEHMQRWVKQKSASWNENGEGIAECAEIVAQSYRDLGCSEVEIIKGKYYPGVWAYYDAGSPITIHNYCMFDTRPANPNEWTYDPWGAELVPMGPYPKVLVGRGAMSAKGPYVAWLNALSSIIKVAGRLPVNIAFLAEGEEIMGSPSYADFVNRYESKLRDVKASLCYTPSQAPNGVVGVTLGLKGMIMLDLKASGKSWGKGPVNTIHSAASSLVDCPPFRLVQALATLTDSEGLGCKIRGLEEMWNYRKPMSAEETQLIEQIASKYKGKDWRDVLPLGGQKNVGKLKGSQEGVDPLINYLYGPTFNISGMRSGFLGMNSGTMPFSLPHEAIATIDMRPVIEESPHDVIRALRNHLDAEGFQDIEMDVHAAFRHCQTSVSDPAAQAAISTLMDWKASHEVWPIQTVGGPWTVVPNQFSVPMVRGGAIGGGVAKPVDEFFVIEGNEQMAGLKESEKFMADMFLNYCRSVGAEL